MEKDLITFYSRYIKFSPSDKFLIIDGVRILNIKREEITSKFNPDKQEIVDIKISSDDQILAIQYRGKETVSIWNSRGKEIPEEYQPTKDSIKGVKFSPNGKILAIFYSNNQVSLWDNQGKKLTDITSANMSSSIKDIEFSPDNKLILITDNNNHVQLRDLQGHLKMDLGEIKSFYDYVRFSPKRNLLAVGQKTNSVHLRATDEATQEFEDQRFPLYLNPENKLKETWLLILQQTGVGMALWVFLVLPGTYLFFRQRLHRLAKPPQFPELPSVPVSETPTSKDSRLSQDIEDEVQAATAIQVGKRSNLDYSFNLLKETEDYLPITRRQMKQSWRYLRRLIRQGLPTELDVKACVNQLSRQGILLQPILRPRRLNCSELLLLIDCDGSMVPFHSLSERLVMTVQQGGRLAKTHIYYFHNCPYEHLYCDRYRLEAKLMQTVIARVNADYTGVMIFSDAGAARGNWNEERYQITKEFLGKLRQKLKFIAWVNPLPQERWTGTGKAIAQEVPMFELSRRGFHQAIDVLRGKVKTP